MSDYTKIGIARTVLWALIFYSTAKVAESPGEFVLLTVAFMCAISLSVLYGQIDDRDPTS